MAKILVTGGAGYIGSILVPELLKHGHLVTVIDNFMFGQSSLLDCCHDKNLTIVHGDVRSRELVNRQLAGVDYIFPLACFTGAPLCEKDPWTAQSVILDAILDLLALRRPEQRIIYPTTNSGYGLGQEDQYCTEETPLRPISLYGRLKVEAEKNILSQPNTITVRLATAFGVSPRMRLDLLVNNFVYRALHDRAIVLFEGHFRRNFIHVRDIARAFLHCLENFEPMQGQCYNVGLSDTNLSKEELCLEIKKRIPDLLIVSSNQGQDPDKRDYLVSNAKIEATGFCPYFSLENGIAELIKGYQIIHENQFSNA